MEPTLQFVVMIDGPSSVPEILEALSDALPGVRNRNWIEIRPNEDADFEAVEGDDGYLFYGFELQATPMGEVTEDHQIDLARKLISAINGKGWKAVVCANFEDKV
jgi:hypothetical protein